MLSVKISLLLFFFETHDLTTGINLVTIKNPNSCRYTDCLWYDEHKELLLSDTKGTNSILEFKYGNVNL